MKKEFIKPFFLQKGDNIAIVSLSSGLLGEEIFKWELDLLILQIKKLGFNPIFMPNSLKGIKFLDEHPECRASDLKEAFTNKNIKGIFCAIGGFDTIRLTKFLFEDNHFVNIVKENPKIFLGFSDSTINHFMFNKIGLITFYGINVLSGIVEFNKKILSYNKRSLRLFLNNKKQNFIIKSSKYWFEEYSDYSINSLGKKRVKHKEKYGYEILNNSNNLEIIEGQILGGCIDSMYEIFENPHYRQINEIYKIFPDPKEWQNKIILLETSEQKPNPELFNKMLLKLKENNVFIKPKCIIVGKPQNEVYYHEYKNILINFFKDTPILYNFNIGHSHPKSILPFNSKVKINFKSKKVILFRKECFNLNNLK